MIRAVIFDLDETLINRNSTMRLFLTSQRKRYPELPDSFVDACIKFQNNGYADKLEAYQKACVATGTNTSTLPTALYADLKEHYGFEAIAFEGAVATLQQLYNDYSLGLITNGRTRGQMAKLDSVRVREYFSAIVISEAHGRKKPDASIFKACLEQLNCKPGEAVYIGDNPTNDIVPAKALGMHAIWLRNAHFAAPDSCDAIVEDIREVPDTIAKVINVGS